jgi:hypothetical protein
MPSPSAPRRPPVAAVVAGPGVVALVAGLVLAWAQAQAIAIGRPWVHPVPPPGAWQPYIHTSAYALFMAATRALSNRLWIAEGLLLYLLSALASGAIAAAMADLGRRWGGAPWAWALGLGVGLSAAALRPFEQYPLSRALVFASVLLVLHVARAPERRAVVACLALCFVTAMLHLSALFVLSPLLLALAALRPRPAALDLGLPALPSSLTPRRELEVHPALGREVRPGVRRCAGSCAGTGFPGGPGGPGFALPT